MDNKSIIRQSRKRRKLTWEPGGPRPDNYIGEDDVDYAPNVLFVAYRAVYGGNLHYTEQDCDEMLGDFLKTHYDSSYKVINMTILIDDTERQLVNI